MTSVRRFSGIGVQFQKRIWKIVQGFFPLHDLSAKPSWVSCSDFIQRLSYNVCTEYEWAKRACLNKSSLVQYYGAIYCNFVRTALTFIFYLQDWHPSCIEISFPIWCSNRWIFADFSSNFHVSGTYRWICIFVNCLKYMCNECTFWFKTLFSHIVDSWYP